MNKNTVVMATLILFSGAIIGCQPKTPTEKVKDKIEDAAHESGQAIDRFGNKVEDKVEDAAHTTGQAIEKAGNKVKDAGK